MQEEKQTYKHVQISEEYHRLLGFYALHRGISRKKAIEDLLDDAIKKEKYTEETPNLYLN